ncbi:MAG: hypothetical protein HKN68_16905, partial [Saprospiraceae bacterium]|nr:hypothetical protein [Saprospiraceae bacterium]
MRVIKSQSFFHLFVHMIYRNVAPSDHISSLIKSFWMVDSEGDATIQREKIIPDGYPEMIFHYGASYSANISGAWYEQEKNLIAGQITNHFFLENTGTIGMIGIKFQPWALKQVFDLDMEALVNRAIPFPDQIKGNLEPLIEISNSDEDFDKKVERLEVALG